MFPESISERLLFNTVKLVASDGSSGTGFFYSFKIDNNYYPTIITNKHVVLHNPNEEVMFYFHLKNHDDTFDNYKVKFAPNWVFHSKFDLCFCFVNPLIEKVKKETGKEVFFINNDESIIPSDFDLKQFSTLEEVVMVGYPIGLSDERNKYPIFRKGYTAAHPAIDFNDDGIGLVDMACFPGSSGSPIFILNEGGYVDKNGNLKWGKSRLFFLGVLFGGPIYNAEGQIVIRDSISNFGLQTGIMTNLGYYIKSSAIKDFNERITAILKLQQLINGKK